MHSFIRFLIHIPKIEFIISVNFFQVDEDSTAYGGELVADVLKVDK